MEKHDTETSSEATARAAAWAARAAAATRAAEWATAKWAAAKAEEARVPAGPRWMCPCCFSTNVQTTAWIYPNEDNRVANHDPPSSYDWCDDCENEIRLIDYVPPEKLDPRNVALSSIVFARDYYTAHGAYPAHPYGPAHNQSFDDWAADLAEEALLPLREG